MLVKNRTAPASEARRAFLREGFAFATGVCLLPMLWPLPTVALAPSTQQLLEESPFVYISPLAADGSESACHGEVWYGWHMERVWIVTARTTWKARALQLGRKRARIWVGNHGRWKGLLGKNQDFRRAPSFEAEASQVRSPELFDGLMRTYAQKYAPEFDAWEERMRTGFASGERLLLQYKPIE